PVFGIPAGITVHHEDRRPGAQELEGVAAAGQEARVLGRHIDRSPPHVIGAARTLDDPLVLGTPPGLLARYARPGSTRQDGCTFLGDRPLVELRGRYVPQHPVILDRDRLGVWFQADGHGDLLIGGVIVRGRLSARLRSWRSGRSLNDVGTAPIGRGPTSGM